MRATMEAFVEQAELEQAAVVLGFPGPRSLGRNFEIPKFKGKKSAEAIAYEARMQIPIPADAIYYDWHPWPAAKDATFEKVALLAARREHVQRVIDLCQDLPLKPLAVQSVCIALYNAAVHELLEEPADVPVKASAKGPAAETRDEPPDSARDNAHRAIAILDLGAESTSLVVASRSLIRFRNIALGTHRLDQALMSRFQLTRAQARQLRERPQSARWMYQTDEVVCEFADELSREVRRTLRVFEAEEIVIERLLCTGAPRSSWACCVSWCTASRSPRVDIGPAFVSRLANRRLDFPCVAYRRREENAPMYQTNSNYSRCLLVVALLASGCAMDQDDIRKYAIKRPKDDDPPKPAATAPSTSPTATVPSTSTPAPTAPAASPGSARDTCPGHNGRGGWSRVTPAGRRSGNGPRLDFAQRHAGAGSQSKSCAIGGR